MLLPDPQFARSDILRIFNHAQLYLFLGAAITTVGVLSACFSLLRRRFDPLLLWFALFAILYGLRLEMHYQLLWAFGLRPAVFRRVLTAVGYLLPMYGCQERNPIADEGAWLGGDTLVSFDRQAVSLLSDQGKRPKKPETIPAYQPVPCKLMMCLHHSADLRDNLSMDDRLTISL